MKDVGGIAWSIVFIILVILAFLHLFNIITLHFFAGWWTLFIIVPSLLALLRKEDRKGGIIGLIIGCLFLVAARGFTNFDFAFKLIIVVIFFGIIFSIISNVKKPKLNEDDPDSDNFNSIFSGHDINYANNEFKGCDCKVIFGGLTIDLRDAIFNQDREINVFVMFGGVDIYVPANVNIKLKSTGIFGGVQNKSNNKDNKINLYINATAVFGGVDII